MNMSDSFREENFGDINKPKPHRWERIANSKRTSFEVVTFNTKWKMLDPNISMARSSDYNGVYSSSGEAFGELNDVCLDPTDRWIEKVRGKAKSYITHYNPLSKKNWNPPCLEGFKQKSKQ